MPIPPFDESADDALIERLQSGDTTAFEPLIERHLRHLRTFVALRSPTPEAIDEITRDSFVIAFQNIASFTIGASFRAWLRAIAWNYVQTEIRRLYEETGNSSRYALQRLTLLDREIATAGHSLEADFFEECLEEIPAPLREILALKYREARANEEIGAQVNRNPASVRAALFRVRQQLSLCIDRKLGRPADVE